MNKRVTRNADDALAVDVHEAARLLSVGKSTIEELIRDGTLRSFKVGKCRRIRRAVIEQYIEDQENGVRPKRRRLGGAQTA